MYSLLAHDGKASDSATLTLTQIFVFVYNLEHKYKIW